MEFLFLILIDVVFVKLTYIVIAFTPSHCFINFLEMFIFWADFNSFGSLSHIWGPKALRLFVPKFVWLGLWFRRSCGLLCQKLPESVFVWETVRECLCMRNCQRVFLYEKLSENVFALTETCTTFSFQVNLHRASLAEKKFKENQLDSKQASLP